MDGFLPNGGTTTPPIRNMEHGTQVDKMSVKWYTSDTNISEVKR